MSKQTYALGTGIALASTLGLAAVVARRLVFARPYTATTTVLRSDDTTTEFVATRDTRQPGRYRIVRNSHGIRVEPILEVSDRVVRRRTAESASEGEWTWDALMFDSASEAAPRGQEPRTRTTHVIHVHGQSMGPRQVLRGLAVWERLGATSEILDLSRLPMRSLDPAAPTLIATRIAAARAAGAQHVVLQGWSAGALACSVAANLESVDALIGVSPLLSVRSALTGAVRGAHLPAFVGAAAFRLLGTPGLSRLAGTAAPLPFDAWAVSGAPTLLIHSRADAVVARADVNALARDARVETASFATAPHTLEWNEDPERWEDLVEAFAQRVLVSGQPGVPDPGVE